MRGYLDVQGWPAVSVLSWSVDGGGDKFFTRVPESVNGKSFAEHELLMEEIPPRLAGLIVISVYPNLVANKGCYLMIFKDLMIHFVTINPYFVAEQSAATVEVTVAATVAATVARNMLGRENGGAENGLDMNVAPAWAKGYTGKGVVVSILDDGIQTNHPDLVDNYILWNFVISRHSLYTWGLRSPIPVLVQSDTNSNLPHCDSRKNRFLRAIINNLIIIELASSAGVLRGSNIRTIRRSQL
uniref:Peptidase S8/S53 domain-containing protein n=2 Tax=Rhodnius prolixus TaxID=13249 RepID=T1IB24_RHOPR